MTARPSRTTWWRADPWRAACLALLVAIAVAAAGWTAWSTHRALASIRADVAAQGQAIKEIATWINARVTAEQAVVGGATPAAPDGKEPPR